MRLCHRYCGRNRKSLPLGFQGLGFIFTFMYDLHNKGKLVYLGSFTTNEVTDNHNNIHTRVLVSLYKIYGNTVKCL